MTIKDKTVKELNHLSWLRYYLKNREYLIEKGKQKYIKSLLIK